ncbi:hypothetical protein ACWEOG_02055 [Amycolatopsis japonica]
MILLPEFDGWRAGLLAADIVIGDHGSVTGYAAALGKPTLLAAFDDVPPGTPIAALEATAPKLPAPGPFLPYLESTLKEHRPDRFTSVSERVSSLPGRSLATLRGLFYRLLNLSEPPCETTIEALPVPDTRPPRSDLFADLVTGQVHADSRRIALERRPAEVLRPDTVAWHAGDVEQHLNCPVDHPARTLVANAAVVTVRQTDPGPSSQQWWRDFWSRHPACTVAAAPHGGTTQVRIRDGASFVVEAPGVEPAVVGSAVYLWRAEGLSPRSLKSGFVLELGGEAYKAEVSG